MSHSIAEAAEMVAQVRKTDRILQIGNCSGAARQPSN